ncbi:hypothetical protein N7462_004578 [Penicillium macrosclerotiorum]|uniref:uncharacterized protein n=1 Tax=Penicillium macrosclerotiorum TaxID=303699 RepID=UPI002547A301|nr:uncharacterized protein N7462_004578 [Penicillium macrosclerotiorum]KAJ5690186.1 hypothetical protein N7462_004578 [Penicillium macrosclerotiorum]
MENPKQSERVGSAEGRRWQIRLNADRPPRTPPIHDPPGLLSHSTLLQVPSTFASHRHMDPPRNRKQRRAAAAAHPSISQDPDIPLAHPERGPPAKKDGERTLYDIIAERQNELLRQAEGLNRASGSTAAKRTSLESNETRFVTIDASGRLVDKNDDISQAPMKMGTATDTTRNAQSNATDEDFKPDTDNPLPPFLDTILLSVPLATLHGTLAFLAAHQYAESTNIPALIKESLFKTLPLLTLLVHFLHGHIVNFKLRNYLSFLAAQPVYILPLTRDKLSFSFLRSLFFPPTLRTILLLPVAVLLGAHLITITNGEPYYAVMKKAPAYGTMWIWCILEMSFGPAVLGALGPLAWGVWWMGYGII